ncbi:MAG TPA: hydantoinase B/oxoprolinase family protein, partial [Candidatus Methylomirabilis sp.]
MSGDVRPGLLLEVRTQMEEAASAMDATLRRGASSAAIARHGSSAAGFYGPTGCLIIGGSESHPLLLEVAAEALAVLVRQQVAARVPEPETLYWTNDPTSGAAGLEELVLAVPVVRDGHAVCFVALTAAHPALGRATLAPVESLRREGLVLPWTRVGRAGRIQGELLDLVAANAGEPAECLGDIRSQVHSLLAGQTVVQGLVDRHGLGDLALVWDALGAGCRRRLRGVLDKLEGGAVEGRVSPFTVRVRAEGERAVVSVGTGEGAPDPPLTPALARAAVRSAFREILAAEARSTGVLGGWADVIQVEHSWRHAP